MEPVFSFQTINVLMWHFQGQSGNYGLSDRSYTDKVYHWVGDKKVYMLKEIADSCVNEFFSLKRHIEK